MAHGDAEIKKEVEAARRLDKELRARSLALDAISELLDCFGSNPAPLEAADAVCSLLVSRFGVARAALYFECPSEKGFAPLRAGCGSGERELPRFAADCGFVRWLSETEGTVHIDEYFSAAGEAASEDEEALRAFVDAGLSRAIPLKRGADLVGMLLYGAPAPDERARAFDDEIASRLAVLASAVMRNAFHGESAAAAEQEQERRSRERSELAGALSEKMRSALSVARSTIHSLDPGELDERMLVELAKSSLADLEGAVERWSVMHDLGEEGDSVALLEARGLVEDALRGMLPELEEKELRVSIDDRSGLREVPLDRRRFPVALRAMLEGAVAGAGRGAGISIGIGIEREGIGGGGGRRAGCAGAESLVVEVRVGCGRGAPRIAFADTDEPDASILAAAGDRRSIDLAVAKRLVSDQRGTFRVTGGGGEKRYEARVPLDS